MTFGRGGHDRGDPGRRVLARELACERGGDAGGTQPRRRAVAVGVSALLLFSWIYMSLEASGSTVSGGTVSGSFGRGRARHRPEEPGHGAAAPPPAISGVCVNRSRQADGSST